MKFNPARYLKLFTILMYAGIACKTDIHNNRTEPENSAEEDQMQNTQSDELVITQKLYDQTFEEIFAFINKINVIIQESLSAAPQLKDQNIVLTSLYDFFIYVFIPSRKNSNLVRIEFITENKVKAITIIKGTPYILYLIEKDKNNEWKISIW